MLDFIELGLDIGLKLKIKNISVAHIRNKQTTVENKPKYLCSSMSSYPVLY